VAIRRQGGSPTGVLFFVGACLQATDAMGNNNRHRWRFAARAAPTGVMFYGKPNSSAQPAGKCHAAGVGNRMIDADQYLASGIQAQFQSRWANNN
jgi:hypothetical protein